MEVLQAPGVPVLGDPRPLPEDQAETLFGAECAAGFGGLQRDEHLVDPVDK